MKRKNDLLLVILLVSFSSLVFSSFVKIKSPNGGESWQLGSEKLITWEKSGNFTKFKIILRKATIGRVGDIALNINPNLTSFSWKKVGEYLGGNVAAGNGYRIRVRGYLTAGGSIFGDSNAYFTITETPKQKPQVGKINRIEIKMITCLSPTGGNYETGQILKINWKTSWKVSNNKVFLLELYSGSGKRFKRIIGTTKPGYRSFDWRIPGDVNPEFYTIRVSARESTVVVRSLSSRFHISRAYEANANTFILKNPKIVNSWKIKADEDVTYSTCKGKRYENDGEVSEPGTVRVGNTMYLVPRYGWCRNRYRSFVYFDLSSIPKDGILVGAQLKFNKLQGACPDNARILVLNQKWNGNTGLWSVPTSEARPGDFKKVVQKWLNFPNANYGIVFALPHDRTRCLLHYDNVRLELKIREKVK